MLTPPLALPVPVKDTRQLLPLAVNDLLVIVNGVGTVTVIEAEVLAAPVQLRYFGVAV